MISQRGSILIRFLSVPLAIFCVVGLSLAVAIFQGGNGSEEKTLLVPRGASVSSVAHHLAESEIIRYPTAFKMLLRFTNGQTRLRAGEYRFRTGMSLQSAMQVLYHGEGILHRVTIPEGFNAKQIAAALAQAGLVNEESFLELALSEKLAAKYKLQAPHLEGFLYPDTYDFSKVDGEERIIDVLVQAFFSKITPEMKQRSAELGLSLEQLVTLASIIEKETGSASERELVSSVFHNRLKKKMRLQSDPTTIYGIANYDGNIRKSDLQTHTPYNTYTIPALPPGPIASPGVLSIQAALHPAESKYLYFVAKKAGEGHIFSETYSSHARNVNTFQKSPKQSSARKPTSLRTKPHKKRSKR